VTLAYSTQADCSQVTSLPSSYDSVQTTSSGTFTDNSFIFPSGTPAGIYFLCAKDTAGGFTSYVASPEEATIDQQQNVRSISTPSFFVTNRLTLILLSALALLLLVVLLIVLLRRRRGAASMALPATRVAAVLPREPLFPTLKEPASDPKPPQIPNPPL